MAGFVENRDRRRSARIAADKEALAFNGGKHGRIIDASMEGLCFQYLAREKGDAERNVPKCKGGFSLDIVLGKYNFALVGLPVKAVADYQVFSRQEEEPAVSVRRRAVTFEKLSPRQLFQLKRFLLLNKYGDGSSYEFETMCKEAQWIVKYAARK